MAAPPHRTVTLPPSRRPFQPGRAVGALVPGITRKAFEKYGFATSALLTDWPAIAGDELAAYTRPERLKWPRGVDAYGEVADGARGRPGATLVLRVDGPRALEVQYRQRQIVDRINAYFGYRAIDDLRLLQAPVTPVRRAADSGAPRSTVWAFGPPVAGAAAATTAAATASDPAGAAQAAQLVQALARLGSQVRARR